MCLPSTLWASGPVAQWSEQGTHNPPVVGSIPTGPTQSTRGYAPDRAFTTGSRGPLVTVWSRLITLAPHELL